MRRFPFRLLALGVFPVVLLAGCNGSSSSSASSAASKKSTTSKMTVPASKVAPMSAIDVNTKKATAPKITLDKKPFHVNKTTVNVLTKGKGKTVTGKDIAYVDYVAVNGKNGKQLINSFSAHDVAVPLSDKNQFPGLVKAIKGKAIGSTMKVAIPPADAFGSNGNAQLGVGGGDTLVFYMKIESAGQPLTQAEGTKVAPKAGLPKVTVPDGKGKLATIDIPKTDPPKKLVAQDLIKGKGKKVEKGDTISVSYTGKIWKSGKIFDATAKHGDGGQPSSFAIGVGQVIPGWDKGLVGKTVGSRVLLVVPPSDGYGKQGNAQGGIKGTDTLVFVVDILAAG